MYCPQCGKQKRTKHSKICNKCNQLNSRTVERPSKEQLTTDIKTLGYCGTGRKYGVTDNAIRKWLKNYD